MARPCITPTCTLRQALRLPYLGVVGTEAHVTVDDRRAYHDRTAERASQAKVLFSTASICGYILRHDLSVRWPLTAQTRGEVVAISVNFDNFLLCEPRDACPFGRDMVRLESLSRRKIKLQDVTIGECSLRKAHHASPSSVQWRCPRLV